MSHSHVDIPTEIETFARIDIVEKVVGRRGERGARVFGALSIGQRMTSTEGEQQEENEHGRLK